MIVVFGLLQRSSARDPDLQNKLASLARQALERAEELKGILPPVEDKPTSHVSVPPKLCTVPEHISSNTTVRATATPNGGKVTCCWLRSVWGAFGISQSQYVIARPCMVMETSHDRRRTYCSFCTDCRQKMFRHIMLTAVAVHVAYCALVKTSVCSEMHIGRWSYKIIIL
jgi:hypothetical protein